PLGLVPRCRRRGQPSRSDPLATCATSLNSGHLMTDNPQTPEPRGLADWLLARGRHWVTTSEAVLSAAESHGFAHQRPQVFQVMTTARLRDREFGRVRIELITSRHASSRAIQEMNTTTGTMR